MQSPPSPPNTKFLRPVTAPGGAGCAVTGCPLRPTLAGPSKPHCGWLGASIFRCPPFGFAVASGGPTRNQKPENPPMPSLTAPSCPNAPPPPAPLDVNYVDNLRYTVNTVLLGPEDRRTAWAWVGKVQGDGGG